MYFAPICWISISSFNETTKCNFSSLKHAQSADIEQSSVFPTTNKLFEDLFLDSFLYLLLSGNLFIPSKPEKHPIWGCFFSTFQTFLVAINLLTHLVCSLSQNCFELYIPDHKDQVIKACKTEADGRVVEGNHTFYRISAPTTEEKDEWINSIKWDTFRLSLNQ